MPSGEALVAADVREAGARVVEDVEPVRRRAVVRQAGAEAGGELLTAQRERDNQALTQSVHDGTFADAVAAIWRLYSRPEHLERIRGFFHVVALAVYEPSEFEELIASLDDLTEMLVRLAERDGRDASTALAMSTVAIASLRGLLLQQLLTPAVSAEDALELVLRMCERPDR